MKYIIRLGILCLMIFNFQYIAVSQSFNETVEFADQQFENQNYQLAVKEYQRALLFANGRKLDYLYGKIANAFFINKQYNQAQYFYELSYKTCLIDSLKYELAIKKMQCFLFLEQFDKALIEIFNFPKIESEFSQKRKDFYLAIIYFGLEKFDKSEQCFLKIVKSKEERSKISKIFKKKRLLHRPNPKTARILSMIIPGAGQLYAGDIKNSLNSLGLTGGFAALGLFLASKYSYLDASLTALPWFARYYQGGYESACEIATNKRDKKRSRAYKQIIATINSTDP